VVIDASFMTERGLGVVVGIFLLTFIVLDERMLNPKRPTANQLMKKQTGK